MYQKKHLRLLLSEIELHGYVNESKGIHLKNFSYYNFKVIETNNYKLKSLIRLSYMSWGTN